MEAPAPLLCSQVFPLPFPRDKPRSEYAPYYCSVCLYTLAACVMSPYIRYRLIFHKTLYGWCHVVHILTKLFFFHSSIFLRFIHAARCNPSSAMFIRAECFIDDIFENLSILLLKNICFQAFDTNNSPTNILALVPCAHSTAFSHYCCILH